MKRALRLSIFGVVSFLLLLAGVLAFTWNDTKPKLEQLCCMQAVLAEDLCQASSGQSKKLLFVGGTLTANYMIPWTVAYFAERKLHSRPKISQIVVPEWTLERHYEEGKFQKLIKSDKWDVVILQEPVGRAMEEKEEMNRFVRLMAKDAKASGAKVLLFEAPGAKGHTNEQAKITRNMTEISKELDITLIPIGRCLSSFDKDQSSSGIDVYEGGLRPSQWGSYLAGCLIFESIYGQSCLGAPSTIYYTTWVGAVPTISISDKDADLLQRQANKWSEKD